jgi:B12 binding protein
MKGQVMKLLAVHPSGLMYTRVFLTLEPLGLELIAEAARQAGHDVRIVDLQVEPQRQFLRTLEIWRPDAVCFGGNYLANVPEIVELARLVKTRLSDCFVFVGGHSVSFIAPDLLAHAEGAIDCVLRGEGEASVALLLQEARGGDLTHVPGAVSGAGEGPPPRFVDSLSRGAAGHVHGGDRLPWVSIDRVDNFTTLSAIGWQVHVYGEASAELVTWCRDHHVPLHVFGWRTAHEAVGLARDAVYLLRPDTYVALADAHGTTASLDRSLADHSLRLL